MLSTDTIFVLRDRFEGRNEKPGKAGPEPENERAHETRGARTTRTDPAVLQELRIIGMTRSSASRDRGTRDVHRLGRLADSRRRGAVQAAALDAAWTTGRDELGAMRGILIGVAIGASCWGLVGTLVYRLMG